MRITVSSETLPGGKGIKVTGFKIKISLNGTIKKIRSCIKQVQSNWQTHR